MLTRRDIDELLAAISEALEQHDLERVARLLAAEGRVFLDGFEHIAAEIGYARSLLAQGDVDGALRVIRAVPTGGQR